MNTDGMHLLAALDRAEHAARRGKRTRPDVATFELAREHHLLGLRNELATRTYRPAPHKVFTVTVPKTRTIAALPFRDRIVQHLLMATLAPRIEKTLVPQTYACLPNRGTHRALARAAELTRHHRYCLQLDVRKFFPSIDHAILRAGLRRLLRRDEDFLAWLTDVFLDHDGQFERRRVYFTGDDLFATLRPVGLPIGNLTSQWWANLYLSPLDHRLANDVGIGAFVRYMDDLVAFDDDPNRLAKVRDACVATCDRLRLRLHAHKTHIVATSQGFRFLGFRLARRDGAISIRLTTESATRVRRRFARFAALYTAGAISQEQVRSSVLAWLGHARHGHTRTLCRELLDELCLTRQAGQG